MKEKLKALKPYIIIAIIIVLIRSFIITPVRVNGGSMTKTLNPGDILLLKKYDKVIKRGDIVVVKNKSFKGDLVKRVIALPNEEVEIERGSFFINTKKLKDDFGVSLEESLQKIKLESDEYFIVGDNRTNSIDSRLIGPIKKNDIKGKVIFRIYPFNKIKIIK